MASVTVSKAVKTSVHFIDKGTKVGASYYRETLLQRCLLPEIRQTSGDHFVFQQDSAPSYQAKSTVEFVQHRVTNFTEPSVWPHKSPDLNPVDQAVWGALQQSVYCIPISDSDDLKNRVHTCWKNLDQQIIDKSVDQWHDRLKAVVLVNDGHTEQLFGFDSFAAVLCCVAYAF